MTPLRAVRATGRHGTGVPLTEARPCRAYIMIVRMTWRWVIRAAPDEAAAPLAAVLS